MNTTIEHLKSNAHGHAFALRSEHGDANFLVAHDYALTGHVQAQSGAVWLGNYPALFESAPGGGCSGPQERVRLTAAGIEACRGALAAREQEAA